jgi:hypothetical protein
MNENLLAQVIHDGLGRGFALLRHVSIECRDEPVDDDGQPRPGAVNSAAFRPRIERLRIDEVGIDAV